MVASAFDVDAYLEVETESTYEVTEVYLIYGVAGVEYTYLYRLLDMSLSCEAYLAALSPTLRAAAGACTPYCLAKVSELMGPGGSKCPATFAAAAHAAMVNTCVQLRQAMDDRDGFNLRLFEYSLAHDAQRPAGVPRCAAPSARVAG